MLHGNLNKKNKPGLLETDQFRGSESVIESEANQLPVDQFKGRDS
jgi:hypothetical protein